MLKFFIIKNFNETLLKKIIKNIKRKKYKKYRNFN